MNVCPYRLTVWRIASNGRDVVGSVRHCADLQEALETAERLLDTGRIESADLEERIGDAWVHRHTYT